VYLVFFVGIRSSTEKEKEKIRLAQLLMPAKNTKWTNI
jgi:hypothetical protein